MTGILGLSRGASGQYLPADRMTPLSRQANPCPSSFDTGPSPAPTHRHDGQNPAAFWRARCGVCDARHRNRQSAICRGYAVVRDQASSKVPGNGCNRWQKVAHSSSWRRSTACRRARPAACRYSHSPGLRQWTRIHRQEAPPQSRSRTGLRVEPSLLWSSPPVESTAVGLRRVKCQECLACCRTPPCFLLPTKKPGAARLFYTCFEKASAPSPRLPPLAARVPSA